MKLDSLYPDVAFYGAPGVGKTTAAGFAEQIGYTRISFAGWHKGGLRDIVWRMGLDPNDRRTLNIIGMAGREADSDVWVRQFLAEATLAGLPVVNDDLRGDNEWTALRAAGFVFVHLMAPNAVREERLRLNGKLEGSDAPFLWLLEDAMRYHPDHVLTNDGSEEELYAGITDILNQERSKRA